MLNDFISYLNEQVKNHSIYVWGGQGQKAPAITEQWIKDRETSKSNADKAIAFWEKQIALGYESVLRAFDCSGLGMYWIQNISGLSKVDMSSTSMFRLCKEIKKTELKKGDWVFRHNSTRIYHIGFVVDDSLNVIEARGRNYGVIKRSLNAAGSGYWNRFGRPSYFAKEIEENVAPAWNLARLLKKKSPLMKGEDVKNVQNALILRGYSCGDTGADGIYGNNTEAAVKSFQKDTNLTVDGIVGKNTTAELGGAWLG